jgi:hypothetical protein
MPKGVGKVAVDQTLACDELEDDCKQTVPAAEPVRNVGNKSVK